ncbi:MAG: hypothetical protein KDD64_02625 [Bdellovibrionales bacterium]|nr:hypothetical protein [Bdellovibrionales bacterium]
MSAHHDPSPESSQQTPLEDEPLSLHGQYFFPFPNARQIIDELKRAEKYPAYAERMAVVPNVREIVAEQIFRKLVHQEERALQVVEHALQVLNKEFGLSRDPKLYPSRGLYRAHLIEALDTLSERDRRGVISDIFEISLAKGHVSPQLRNMLERIVSYASPVEKRWLAKKLCDIAEGEVDGEGIGRAIETTHYADNAASTATNLLGIICEACTDFQELGFVVNGVGKKNLLQLKSRELKEYVAIVSVGSKMREQKRFRPEGVKANGKRLRILNKYANGKVVNARLDELQSEIELRRYAIDEDARFKATQTVRHFHQVLDNTEDYLRHERGRLKATKDRRELANTVTRMLSVQCRYNIRCTAEQSPSGSYKVHWDQQLVRDLEHVLSLFPENTILSTPKLRQVMLVPEFKDALTQGQRFSNGPVKISQAAFEEAEREKDYGNIRTFRVLLTHEFGHSVFYGRFGYGGNEAKKSLQEVAKYANPRFDFTGFLDIAGWQVIPPDRFVIERNGQLAMIDGKPFPLDRPVFLDGKGMMLQYQSEDKTLYSHEITSEFPIHLYGRTDPYEDIAEGHVDYVLRPHLQVQVAPWKFYWYESEFGRYRHDNELQQMLADSLPRVFGDRLKLADYPERGE